MAGRASRRAFMALGLGGLVLSACGRKRATRYQGWLFIASGNEKEIAIADLASFRRVASLPMPFAPDQLFEAPGRRVFALCREGRAIVEIDLRSFRAGARIGLPGNPVAARVLPENAGLIVLTENPPALLRVDLSTGRVVARLPLPGKPGDLDLNETLAAVTIPSSNAVIRVGLKALNVAGSTDTALPCAPVRFRRDGKTILAGAASAREIVTVDAGSGRLLARLPLPVMPSRFCFNGDGGQMFVTGTGDDSLAVVSPFQNEVAETILAGRTPYAMAVLDRRNLLFVTNPGSGDLTILDIETRGVSASVHVGESPGEVLLTPDGEYALVVDRHSGTVSVVRIATVLDRKVKTKPLFTVFPTASDARSALIVPFRS